MDITISSKIENDCLLIESQGIVANIEEYKFLTERYIDEIIKNGFNKIIIDELKVKYAKSLVLQSEIVDLYPTDFPKEMAHWKIACIVDNTLMDIGKFWEFKARQSGFNYMAFSSIEEAREFINE